MSVLQGFVYRASYLELPGLAVMGRDAEAFLKLQATVQGFKEGLEIENSPPQTLNPKPLHPKP